MRVVVQRVRRAGVVVAGDAVATIGAGLLVLAGFEAVDQESDLAWMSRKLVGLRIFPDREGTMNHNIAEADGEILAVSQFTLFASTRKGHRPSWARAARGEIAQPLFDQFVDYLARDSGRPVACGVFGADMRIDLVNDGPVTLILDSRSPE